MASFMRPQDPVAQVLKLQSTCPMTAPEFIEALNRLNVRTEAEKSPRETPDGLLYVTNFPNSASKRATFARGIALGTPLLKRRRCCSPIKSWLCGVPHTGSGEH